MANNAFALQLGGFNPRPRGGGDRELVCLRVIGAQFQSAPPRGGRPFDYIGTGTGRLRFNPRPRGGGDRRRRRIVSSGLVSIRAPAGGATNAGG